MQKFDLRDSRILHEPLFYYERFGVLHAQSACRTPSSLFLPAPRGGTGGDKALTHKTTCIEPTPTLLEGRPKNLPSSLWMGFAIRKLHKDFLFLPLPEEGGRGWHRRHKNLPGSLWMGFAIRKLHKDFLFLPLPEEGGRGWHRRHKNLPGSLWMGFAIRKLQKDFLFLPLPEEGGRGMALEV
jgi:hypothetical protein